MKHLFEKMEHGDFIESKDLEKFINELTIAENSLRTLNNPQYKLVLDDIFYKLHRCLDWKKARESGINKLIKR